MADVDPLVDPVGAADPLSKRDPVGFEDRLLLGVTVFDAATVVDGLGLVLLEGCADFEGLVAALGERDASPVRV